MLQTLREHALTPAELSLRMESTRLAVLVVDDEPALREVLSLRIADWGYEVRTSSDIAEAERELDRNPPDLVLCDVVMPGGSGLDLLKRIKRQDEKLPVVMMTAHGDIDKAVDAMKSGAADFLTKPLDYVMLHALLEAAAGELRQKHEARSLDAHLQRQQGAPGIVGQSRGMRDLRQPRSRSSRPRTRRRFSPAKAAPAKRSSPAPCTR